MLPGVRAVLFTKLKGMKMKHIGVSTRPNADGSISYLLRGRGLTRASGVRTGPNPGKRELDRCMGLAREAALTLERELDAGLPVPVQGPDITVEKAALEYLASLEGVQAESTIDAKLAILPTLPRGPVRALTDDVLAVWSETKAGRLQDSTRAKELAHVAAFLGWCVRHGYLAKMPAIVPPRVEYRPPPVVENETVRAAIAAQTTAGRRLGVAILACCGLRNGELVGLPDSAYINNGAGPILRVPQGKHERNKRHGRDLPVGPRLAAMIEAFRAGRGLANTLIPEAYPTVMRRWLDPLELTPKDFRRWFISSLERDGCQDYVIRALAAHRTDKIRDAYSFRLSDARPWAERVEMLVL